MYVCVCAQWIVDFATELILILLLSHNKQSKSLQKQQPLQ